jgi:hypothetical protein
MSKMKESSSGWASWVIYAAVLMGLIGVFNIIQGIFALIDDEHTYMTPTQLIAVDLTGFGWTLVISGTILVVTGVGLMTAKGWARIVAIIVVGLHTTLQVLWLGAYPVWSLLIIGLDVTVLWALTVGWSAAKESIGGYSAAHPLAP